mgnify:FL=1
MTPAPTYRRSRELADRLLEYRSAITRQQADEHFGPHALDACLANGSVARILPAIYVHADLLAAPDVRVRAASKWAEPHGALSGEAALWGWGVLKRPPEIITVQLPPKHHLERPRWIRVIRPDAPLTVHTHGRLTLVGQAEAAAQAWAEAHPRDRIGLVVEAVHRGTITASDVAQAATQRRRLRGRGKLHEVLGLLDGGVTSFLEYVARNQVFPARQFPELRWQHEVEAMGRTRYIDAADPVTRLALEFDGGATHTKAEDRLADHERDAALISIGYTPVHFTFDELMYSQDWCRQVYRDARNAQLARLNS